MSRNTSKVKRAWVAALAGGALLAAGCAAPALEHHKSSPVADVAVQVQVWARAEPEPQLQLELTNLSNHELTLPESWLPWGSSDSLMVVAMTDAPGSQVVGGTRAPESPSAGKVTLRPKQSLSGTVWLARRFGALREALAKKDVVVFWSYRFPPFDDEPRPRASGYVILPRTGLGRAASR